MSSVPAAGYDEHDSARIVEEPVKNSARTAFARDRARVLHSSALRRLASKTQVMVAGESDFQRTRLTHTLEVAQIARELGDALGCDPDVVEVAGLAHDIGHPPFGHNGEEALNEIADRIGGFEGNAQSLRILSRLEAKVVDPRTDASVGLNLSRASLDASCKYPWTRKAGLVKFGAYDDDLEVFAWLREGAPEERTCIEEQVMDWSDDVAYSVHDFEDAVHSRIASLDVFGSRDERRALVEVAHERFPDSGEIAELEEALARLVALDYWPTRFDGSMTDLVALKRFTSYLIGRFCSTAQVATQVEYGPGPHTRYQADLVVPEEVRAEVSVMKAVAVLYVMHRPGADEEYARQREVIAELVNALVLDGGRSLEPWLRPSYDEAVSDGDRLRVIVDQVASLTDVSILGWHRRLVR
ncbi:MAG: deoxyguanosinetriphosphate triphosphohydrolase [Actinobacteria bacterium]|nr:deoxyguanosinetriphosphate triphosphohydrolase [Actinomycetota bacterium]